MRNPTATALVCAAFASLAGCGQETPEPTSGTAYRALSEDDRLAAAAGCRDRAAAEAGDVAAGQLERIDTRSLRTQLDLATTGAKSRRRAFSELCERTLPFVTPAVRVSFVGAIDSGDAHTYQTRSDKPLTIRGTVSPARRGAYVVVRREFGSGSLRGEVGPGGRFVMPTVRLRKQANNSFIVTVHSPGDALQKVRFSAICLDCLASGPPPAT